VATRKATLCAVRHADTLLLVKQSCTLAVAVPATPHIRGRRIFPSVHRFDGHQNAHLRSDLEHRSESRQARSRVAQSGATAVFQWIRILLPAADSNSIRHSRLALGAGAMSSTNLGERGVFDRRLSAATRSRFSLPASRRNCWAVRFTPCFRAALVATVHKSSGIGDFRVRPLLHCSNRACAASMLLVSATCSAIFFPNPQLKPSKNHSSSCDPQRSRTLAERTPIIVHVGCLEGLRVRGGPEAVGHATTTAVVKSTFLVILADLASTATFYFRAGAPSDDQFRPNPSR
jgi:permease MlaE